MVPREVEDRARASQGASNSTIYRLVAGVLRRRCPGGAHTLLDIGCGNGALWKYVREHTHQYVGVDVVKYPGFPATFAFHFADLNEGVPLPDACAEVVISVETIEHLENPRAFVRELARLTRPDGLVLLTTPNQLSLLSKMTLLLKNQFNAFQEGPGLYPAHRTALLEIDLLRIGSECGLEELEIDYTNNGRIPGSRWHWPHGFGLRGRAFSDNILLSAQRRRS